jgi:hypothetical protein
MQKVSIAELDVDVVGDSIIVLEFVPSQEEIIIVVAAGQEHPGAFLLDKVHLYALDTLERNVYWTDDFSTEGDISPWRNSILPGDEVDIHRVHIGELRQDSLSDRLRLDMTMFPPPQLNPDPEQLHLRGAIARRIQLQEGKEYQLSFRMETDSAMSVDDAQVLFFSPERFYSGILEDPDHSIILRTDTTTTPLPDPTLAQASRLCSVLASTMPIKSTTSWQAMIIKLSLLLLEVSS